ncbi:translocator protein-like protein [Hyaloraphidium curvatum]|nr:translocator protein-like protein [Hyaloraphidium curvatum]
MASGFVTRTSVKTWYKDLKKPELVPPNYLFPIAWTTLYICMGYASYRVYNTYTPRTILESGPLKLYLAQLTLNLLWSPLFFYYKRVRWAMIDISALWFLVAATGVSFFRRDKLAGYLMIPYAIWVSFASYLNWGVLTLNPEWADGGPKKNQ